MYAQFQELQSCDRGYFYTSDEEALMDFIKQEKLKADYKWEICSSCRGEGSLPFGGGVVLTSEDFAQDPDFREEYFAGRYDKQCRDCQGHPGRQRVPDTDAWPPEVRQRWEHYLDGVHQGNAESLAEKRAGC